MARAKIVNFNPSAIREEDILWVVSVHCSLEDDFSCSFSSHGRLWCCKVNASTLEHVDSLIAECRRALGLEWKEPANAKAN